MHFIENHALRVLVQKSDWVVFGKAPHVEVLQRVVRQVWEQICNFEIQLQKYINSTAVQIF